MTKKHFKYIWLNFKNNKIINKCKNDNGTETEGYKICTFLVRFFLQNKNALLLKHSFRSCAV